MSDTNIHIIIGNIVKDAEVKSTSTGKSVANFRVATSMGFGEKKITDYHGIVAWEKLAEQAGLLAKTGVRVYIEGRSKTRNYESTKHPGEKVYVTETTADIIRYFSADADGAEEDLSEISFSK